MMRWKCPFFVKQLSVFLVLLLDVTSLHRVEATVGVCSVENCTNGTRCVLSQHQRSCRCATGYYGDLCDKDAHVTALCGKNYIGIVAMEDYFKYYNVPMESLHLPNRSCAVQRMVVEGVAYYISRISKDDYLTCGGKPMEKSLTRISYSLSLQSDPQVIGNIIRNPIIVLDYKCSYPYIRIVSLAFAISPVSSVTVIQMDEIPVMIKMLLYTDDSYGKALSSAPSIELGSRVYVEVQVTEPADLFLLRLNHCWATQFPEQTATEGFIHQLLLNGCADDLTFAFLNVSAGESGHNGESDTIRYSFEMFHFEAGPLDLYLHCAVQLCDVVDRESCLPKCNSISKREAVRGDPTSGFVSYGPIRIKIPDSPHSSILATVVLPLIAVGTVGFFLITLVSVAKAGSRRLKQKEEF